MGVSRLETAPLAVFVVAKVVAETVRSVFFLFCFCVESAQLMVKKVILGKVVENVDFDRVGDHVDEMTGAAYKAIVFVGVAPALIPLSLFAPSYCPRLTHYLDAYHPKAFEEPEKKEIFGGRLIDTPEQAALLVQPSMAEPVAPPCAIVQNDVVYPQGSAVSHFTDDKRVEEAFHTLESKLRSKWFATPEAVQTLWEKAANHEAFASTWKGSSRVERRAFVELLGPDTSVRALNAKDTLVSAVYKNRSGVPHPWPKQDDTPVFYHATDWDGLKGILRSGKLEVRHEGKHPGAFVSTYPELRYGPLVLVFRRNIERRAELAALIGNSKAVWAGFNRDIPINPSTLLKVLVVEQEEGDLEYFRRKCRKWSGRDIDVEAYAGRPAGAYHTLVPTEWFAKRS